MSPNNINTEQIKNITDIYYYSTDIPILYINSSGDIEYRCQKEEKFCSMFCDLTGDACPCGQTHLYAAKQAMKLGEAYIFSCPAGLIHFTYPHVSNTSFIGAFIAGPILLNYPDDLLVDGIMQKYDINISMRSKIYSSIKTIPVVEPSKVTYLSKLLRMLIDGNLNNNSEILKNNSESTKQQSEINSSICKYKNFNNDSYYPYESEKELMLKVKSGDLIGAKTILNDLLGFILFSSGGNMEIIKARVLELCSLLSRAAVEGGADINQIFGLNYSFINELSNINSLEHLSIWLVKVLCKFTDKMFPNDIQNTYVIKNAINYINKNYKKNITLDEVANHVHLNPAYFSTLFKKELKISFKNYLNKIRIEESKISLKKPDKSILEIALEVGYEDQSYFTKVFKNITGITPKEYRNGNI